MDFLLEPMELGSEFEELLNAAGKITCEVGYTCSTGTIEPDDGSGDN